MTTCDDILLMLFLRGGLDGAAADHVRGCTRCREDEALVHALRTALAADAVPEPSAGLRERVLGAAAPALAANARAVRRPDWPRLVRAIGVALLPLPLIVLADVSLLRALYSGLSTVLPGLVSGYLVLTYAATLTLLLAASYAAVPLLAGREERHA